VLAAIEAGTLPLSRLTSMRQLVAEELSVEEEQIDRERAQDRRGFRRKKPQ
jgi:hypothetical protein